MLNDIVSRFLLVFLTIEAVLQEATIYRRSQRLSAMTNGLDLGDAYGATLERIKAQGGERARLGMAALMSRYLFRWWQVLDNSLARSILQGYHHY